MYFIQHSVKKLDRLLKLLLHRDFYAYAKLIGLMSALGRNAGWAPVKILAKYLVLHDMQLFFKFSVNTGKGSILNSVMIFKSPSCSKHHFN